MHDLCWDIAIPLTFTHKTPSCAHSEIVYMYGRFIMEVNINVMNFVLTSGVHPNLTFLESFLALWHALLELV